MHLNVSTTIEYIIHAGRPEFIVEPPSEMKLIENSRLFLRIEMEGNPKPQACFKWTHLSSSSVVNVSSPRSNQFHYHAIYKMNNVDASFCGKQLQTTLRNNMGSSTTKHITVIILCKLPSFILLQFKRY